MSEVGADATQELAAHTKGAPHTAAELLPMVYDQLRALAHHYLDDENGYHTLQPTALVHEAYLRLVEVDGAAWKSRNHFYAMASKVMRSLLVDQVTVEA